MSFVCVCCGVLRVRLCTCTRCVSAHHFPFLPPQPQTIKMIFHAIIVGKGGFFLHSSTVASPGFRTKAGSADCVADFGLYSEIPSYQPNLETCQTAWVSGNSHVKNTISLPPSLAATTLAESALITTIQTTFETINCENLTIHSMQVPDQQIWSNWDRQHQNPVRFQQRLYEIHGTKIRIGIDGISIPTQTVVVKAEKTPTSVEKSSQRAEQTCSPGQGQGDVKRVLKLGG